MAICSGPRLHERWSDPVALMGDVDDVEQDPLAIRLLARARAGRAGRRSHRSARYAPDEVAGPERPAEMHNVGPGRAEP